jgi:hypothetical protein
MDPRPAASGPLSQPAAPRHRIRAAAASALCALAAAACGTTSTGSPSPTATASRTATPGATASSIEARLLVQQGLAIGLASNVVQSQVTVLTDALLGSTSCSALDAGTGSSKVLQKSTTGGVITVTVDVYYDGSCAQPYIEAAAQLTATEATSTISITETATYLGPGGATLGALQLSESVILVESSNAISTSTVDGTGTFTPHDGAPAVSLGLECAIPAGSETPPPFVCSGAVAQPLPAIDLSLASVAPLTITLTPITGGGSDDYSVAFAGTQSTSEKGALGALSITTPTSTTFAIGGSGTAMPSNATSGHAALFALFSPAPTGWTVTDATDGSVFSLTLMSTTQLTGTVTTAAGASLAQLTLDQSGSGTITYTGASSAPITSWTLGG